MVFASRKDRQKPKKPPGLKVVWVAFLTDTLNLKNIAMKNIQITWADFPEPCYDPQERYGDCPAVLGDLLNDERIPSEDRIWAFCVCVKVPRNKKRLFAVRAVRETPLENGGFVLDLLTDKRSINALTVAERYANGEATGQELHAAYCAAWDASYSGREAASIAASWSAANADEWDFSGASVRAAAMAAARSAEYNGAWSAQLKIIQSMI